jgi:hypothetical protein
MSTGGQPLRETIVAACAGAERQALGPLRAGRGQRKAPGPRPRPPIGASPLGGTLASGPDHDQWAVVCGSDELPVKIGTPVHWFVW